MSFSLPRTLLRSLPSRLSSTAKFAFATSPIAAMSGASQPSSVATTSLPFSEQTLTGVRPLLLAAPAPGSLNKSDSEWQAVSVPFAPSNPSFRALWYLLGARSEADMTPVSNPLSRCSTRSSSASSARRAPKHPDRESTTSSTPRRACLPVRAAALPSTRLGPSSIRAAGAFCSFFNPLLLDKSECLETSY